MTVGSLTTTPQSPFREDEASWSVALPTLEVEADLALALSCAWQELSHTPASVDIYLMLLLAFEASSSASVEVGAVPEAADVF